MIIVNYSINSLIKDPWVPPYLGPIVLQRLLSFDKSNRAIQRKYKWWAFLKISVENLVGHPIFSNSTIKGSSHSKSEEITSCWNCHPFWFVSPLCRFFSLSFGGFDVLCYTGTVDTIIGLTIIMSKSRTYLSVYIL